MRKCEFGLGLLMIALVALGQPLKGQGVSGVVVRAASGGEPIAGALITLFDLTGRPVGLSVTNTLGEFYIRAPGSQRYSLRATALSYAPAEGDVIVPADSSVIQAVVRLEPEPIHLPGLAVNVTRISMRLELVGYYRRKSTGLGYHMEATLPAQQNASLTSLIRGMRGVTVTAPLSEVFFQNSGQSGYCRPILLIDGFRWDFGGGSEGLPLDAIAPPGTIEAVEVYLSPNEIPASLPVGMASCGAIAVWLKG